MNHDRFVLERQSRWQELEARLTQLDRRGWRSFKPDDLDKLSTLYLTASADLAVAASRFAGGRTHQYLNGLVARAHARLYSTSTTTWRDVWQFVAVSLPAAFWRFRRAIALAFAVFVVGACFGYAVWRWQPQYAVHIVPENLLWTVEHEWSGPPPADREWGFSSISFSTMLMVHNIQVAVIAFALGLTLGIGTTYILFVNGAMLGALAAAVPRAWMPHVWSLIAPHGVPELLAIFIAGGAGYHLAWCLIQPGDERRIDSLSRRGRGAMILLMLVVILLIVAGLIEGLLTPSLLPRVAKFSFAGLMAVAIVLYLRPWHEKVQSKARAFTSRY